MTATSDSLRNASVELPRWRYQFKKRALTRLNPKIEMGHRLAREAIATSITGFQPVARATQWILFLAAVMTVCHAGQVSVDLEKSFAHPPDSARPWVYWFWLNSNISSNGITADLEAMKRVGIGGVLIMEVDQGAPVGPVAFMSPQWRQLFKHVVTEAQRLGLEVNLNNDAGWNGSGGPWIKPEQSMQKVVWSETNLTGPLHFEGILEQPKAVAGFYRDIAVQAFPAPATNRIDRIKIKASYEVGHVGSGPQTNLPPDAVIEPGHITDLSGKLDSAGRLVWDVPPGPWTLLRFGHTSTGVECLPAPASGRGLECDKLSKEGIEANFTGMMVRLIADVGPAAGKTLAATHIDSWENGAQNWTARMREEFQKRRGYALRPFLPVMTGRVVGSLEISERFLWDLRRTVSELVVENYAGRMRELAHAHGLRFTVEAYGSPCDNLPYAGESDEPMGEFWSPAGAMETCRGMASAAHVYGKRIVGAEAFTAGDGEKWLEHPASIKALGDRAFCEGINRFVFHRYALQPWREDRRPGMTMGPWGQHYERTQTWWDWIGPWHEYLARCQFMLRQGRFVADVCYLQAEAPPKGLGGHERNGYDWDDCPAEVVLTRMSVKDGCLVLPDGMTYRVLALPDSRTMTPALLRTVKELVAGGATVIGPRPTKSPSLSGYPKCDEEVKRLADELWSDEKIKLTSTPTLQHSNTSFFQHRVGSGRVVWGLSPERFLAQSGLQPDFVSQPRLRYIHRAADGTDIYFVSNYQPHDVEATCVFRVSGRQPELWWPDTGLIEHAAVWQDPDGATSVPLRLGPAGSVFVVFRQRADGFDPIVAVRRDGKSLLPTPGQAPKITLEKAVYGVLNDPKRTRDVRAKLQKLVDAGEYSFQVARMAEGDDPAFMVVKTLVVEGTADGKPFKVSGKDPETLYLTSAVAASERVAEVRRGLDGHLLFEAWQPGHYELETASRHTRRVQVPALLPPLELRGPWEVRFALGRGAPEKITLDTLIDWAKHSDPGVKHFSGTATYRTTFQWTSPESQVSNLKSQISLDLGTVAVMAKVKLNGRDLGILWKPPFRVDVTEAVKPGDNMLEVEVVNLWVNRMLGDEQLPEDSERNPNGTLKAWPQWLQEGKPSPAGRFTFTSWRLWKKDSPLQPSGLLGPVRLILAQQLPLTN
ncbi:MAG: hypothetical protein HYY23_04355 [Verrucomicrobia bacterium]|nr:hypothetical protein [Verrucomicrobiota bacterium]